MKRILLVAGLIGLLQFLVHANDQLRDWTYASGGTVQAEILGFDETSRILTLRMAEGVEKTFPESDFSTLDRAWILQWVEQDEENRALLSKVGGHVTKHVSEGRFPTPYAVYHPPVAQDGKKPPMLLLFHPGGKGVDRIYFYIEAAARSGMTLVSFDIFRNGPDEAIHAKERFDELLPIIEKSVPHDPKKVFMGGNSGAALRSYRLSATVDRPWAGIFACGGWLGPKDTLNLDFPPMRVAMVNGDKDHGANAYIDRDMARLTSRGCVVSVHAFEGGHQMPPASVQEKAMRWLLEE